MHVYRHTDINGLMEQKPLEEFTLEEVRDMLHEKTNQLHHLLCSQHQLLEALRVDPEDKDFLEAYGENKDTIAKRERSIHTLTEYLKRHDPSFRIDSIDVPSTTIRSVSAEENNTAGEPSTLGIFL